MNLLSKVHKTSIFFGLKLLILIGVFGILISHTNLTVQSWWIIILYLFIGYYFGKLTCGTHSKKYGLWMTLGLFIALNFIHSLFDGILSFTMISDLRNLAIYTHELIRQPALYVVVWSMLEPFHPKGYRTFLAFIAVTGVWAIGMFFGMIGSSHLFLPTGAQYYIALTLFIFMGDIIHHLADEYVHMKSHHNKTI
jgi:hypothetical protein